MSYAAKDQAAAVGDLIALDGEMIEIGGHKYKAHIERGPITQGASEFGLDNREEELTATILNRGSHPLKHTDPVKFKGRPYQITEIKPEGRLVTTLTLRND